MKQILSVGKSIKIIKYLEDQKVQTKDLNQQNSLGILSMQLNKNLEQMASNLEIFNPDSVFDPLK